MPGSGRCSPAPRSNGSAATGFVRNVLVAIGNAPEPLPELVAAAEARLGDASALVRATALWAYARLVPGAAIPRHLRDDPDPLVQAEIAAITASA